MTTFTIRWRKNNDIEGAHSIDSRSATNIADALVKFHVDRQRVEGLGRDSYSIVAVTTSHIPMQSYLPEDLPARNPDATKIKLSDAAEERIATKTEEAKKNAS